MPADKLGRAFGYDGEKVWFFEAEGLGLLTKAYLTREALLRKSRAWRDEHEAENAIIDVRRVIRQALGGTGYKNSNVRVVITSRQAVLLFLTGYLNRQHLDKAMLPRDNIIEIPNVTLARGITLTVHVIEDPNIDYNIAVTDARGKILAQSP